MKYLSTLTLVLLCLSVGNSQNAVNFSFQDAIISGNQVEMEMTVKDFKDITSFQLFFFWDESVLEVAEMTSTHPNFSDIILLKPENDMAHPQKGKFRLQWFDGLGDYKSLDDDATLCTVLFNMIGDPCAKTTFELKDLGTEFPNERIEVLTFSDLNISATTTPIEFQVPGTGCETASVSEKEVASVRIYPNPVRDNLQVTFSNHTPISSSLMLYNEDGRLLSDNPLGAAESNIDISDINNGIYFYEIQDKGVVVHQGQIMKI